MYSLSIDQFRTTNFIHSHPLTCVSIGLAVGATPVVGVVHAPCQNELYIAVAGHGAYLNGKRLHVSVANSIHESVIVSYAECVDCMWCCIWIG